MADDNSPKISSIDELVNELTKKNSNTPPPNLPTGQAGLPTGGQSKPVQMSPKPPVVPPPILEIQKPRFTPPPIAFSLAPKPAPAPAPSMPPRPQTAPSPAPAPAKPPTPPGQPGSRTSGSGPAASGSRPEVSLPGQQPIKEYQSSIRTMKEDITTLKQGQRPFGVDTSRKVEAPAPAAPAAPKPAPAGPGQQFKMPSVGLGQAEKTGQLPQERGPKPQIYVPPASPSAVSAGSNSRLFMLIAGAAVLFGILYWFLILKQPAMEIVEESPTPVPTQTPSVGLSDIFPILEANLTVNPNNQIESLKEGVNGMTVDGGIFRRISVKKEGLTLTWKDFFSVPQQVLDALSVESLMLAYGQRELFNQGGQINPAAPSEERLVVIAEIRDLSFANQGMSGWEPTMAADLREIFTLNPAKQSSQEFMNNTYQGVAIRYKNFPNPDRSIDHGIVNATNGRSYIVITNSRESMFAAIDVLKGLTKLNPATPVPSPEASPSPSL
ncbi:MAG: hypothetical protein WD989_00120 [Candidatus Paceibacterota bacterium]